MEKIRQAMVSVFFGDTEGEEIYLFLRLESSRPETIENIHCSLVVVSLAVLIAYHHREGALHSALSVRRPESILNPILFLSSVASTSRRLSADLRCPSINRRRLSIVSSSSPSLEL